MQGDRTASCEAHAKERRTRHDEGTSGMRRMRKAVTTAGLLGLALVPLVAAVSPEPTPPAHAAPPRMPVVIAQPLAAMDGTSLVVVPSSPAADAMLPESGMLVLVGTALMGLAAIVRRTTKNNS